MHAITVVRKLLGPFQVNTYVVVCPQTGQSAIIDPAGDPESLLAILEERAATAVMILNTHGHPDHVLANAALRETLGVDVWMHGEDSGLFADAPEISELEHETGLVVDTLADRLLTHGQRLELGMRRIQVIHTPGHTPGSCCFLIDDQLFTGDTLFVGDVGRTDLKGGSLTRLIDSIATRLLPLPNDTAIWPGHHYHIASERQAESQQAPSTLGREKRENPYITDFILDP